MRRTSAIFLLSILIAVTASACGGVATPVPDSASLTLAADEAHSEENVAEENEPEEVAVEPTNTPVPPTPTPVSPTAAPTTEPPTEVPTTEAPAAAEDPLVRVITLLGDPVDGERLFSTTFTTASGQWHCTQCHNIASEDRLIGPGMLNLRERAATRIEGVPAEVYVFNSIIHPTDFIVPGDPEFAPNLMPTNYRDIFTDQQLYNLVSYLLSLQG